MKFSSVEIIYNPNSTGNSHDVAKKLKSDLKTTMPELPVHLHATKYAGHAEKLAYTLASEHAQPLIVSSSGDGGYNEVVNGAMRAQSKGAHPVCAVLAAGNANDHSRTLLHEPLADLIRARRVSRIDLLKVRVKADGTDTERYAHSYVGFGLTPVVATELNKASLNALRESWIVVKTFVRYRPIRIRVQKKILELDSILFTNIGEMAKFLTVSQSAEATDGQFEVVLFKHTHKLRLVRRLAKAALRGLDSKKKYQEYSFTTLKRMPAQLDGEVLRVPKGAVVTVTSEHGTLSTLVS
jgi:diacylglycerol kinase family enzyme